MVRRHAIGDRRVDVVAPRSGRVVAPRSGRVVAFGSLGAPAPTPGDVPDWEWTLILWERAVRRLRRRVTSAPAGA